MSSKALLFVYILSLSLKSSFQFISFSKCNSTNLYYDLTSYQCIPCQENEKESKDSK